MSSFGKDSRFSRVLTDPRFLPMPTFEKKVKIDKRFNAIFTSKDFGHRTLLDKRGRPIHDVSKRGKHVMQQFYELSSDEDKDSSDSDESEDEEGKEKDSGDDAQEADSKVSKKKQKKEASSAENNEVKKQLKKKNKKKPDEDIDTSISNKKSKAKVAKLTNKGKEEKQTTKRTHDDDDNEMDNRKPERAAKKMKKEEITKSKAKKKSADDDKSEEDSESGEEEETSESDDSSDEDDDELPEYTTEYDLEETAVEHKWNELHADAPEVSESTRRLAVCNMDWDFVKAQDLYVLFKSFATEGGSVHSVTIYPSEFGKERMADEAMHGPKELRDSLKNGTGGGAKDSEKKKKKEKYVDPQKLKRMEKQIVNADREVLRDYQMNRMRYYYAVVDCSSVEVADNIYKECDGQEYQLSAVKLDLRFIPEDMTFDDVPKESFGEEQGLVDYTPRLFYSSALSQAKVEVTWDETDFDRLHRKMVHFQHKDLENIVEENKYADIIAPPESDSDEDGGRPQWLKSVLADDEEEEDISEEQKISMYRQVLMDKLAEEEEKEKQENEVDKELEWQPGLKSAVQNKLKKSEKAKGTLVDDFLEKKKEKRKKKRDLKKVELAKAEKGDDDDEDDDDVGDDFDVPGIMDDQLKEMMESEGIDLSSLKEKKGKKKDKKKKGAEENKDDSEDEREKAELELLLMGDGEEKKVGKPEKVQEGKLSRRQKQKKSLLAKKEKMKVQEDLEVDVDDPRFSAMFSSHHFHIDPNAPEFKKTNNMMKLVDEQIKRKPEAKKDGGVRKNNEGDANDMTDSKSVSKKLVESLKRKMKKNK